MKLLRYLTVAILVAATCLSCQKFDDSELWKSIKQNESRIAALEKICSELNTNVSSLQTIVLALQNNDYITGVTPVMLDGKQIGYTITFFKSNSITIYHGTNGVDGNDGQDGKSPQVGVKCDSDGIWYWTVNGEWLLDDNGNKVRASAKDGADGNDGTNGKDGITPQFKIVDGYWYISYDNGSNWTKLGKATGSNGVDGINGENGDSVFKSVTVSDGYVVFTLNDENDTVIKIPFYTDTVLRLTTTKGGMIAELISDTQERTTISLSVDGPIDAEDIMFIRYHLTALESLDLSNAIVSSIPENGFKGMRRLKIVKLPDSTTTIGTGAFTDCNLLTTLIAKRAVVSAEAITDCPYMRTLNIGAVAGTFENFKLSVTLNGDENGDVSTGTVSVDSLFFGSTVKTITSTTLKKSHHIVFDSASLVEEITDEIFKGGDIQSIVLPKNLKTLGGNAFRNCTQLESVVFPEDCAIERLQGKHYVGNTSATLCGMFEGCSLMTKVTLPSNLIFLSGGIFYGNNSITEVEILGSEADLDIEGYHATYYMDYYSITCGAFPTNMKKLIIHRRIPPTCKGAYTFYQLTKNKCTLYVPSSSVSKYRSSSDWSDFREILAIE